MRSQKVEFENTHGQNLIGQIDLPLIGSPRAFVLFAHCFTCSKNLKAVENISRAITNEGMGLLRFDFTGLGQSAGDFSDTNFSSNLSDLNDACKFLERNYTAPQLLMGHSLGGAAVLHVASQFPSVKAVVTIGAPADPKHVRHLIRNEKEIIEKGQAQVDIGGRPFTIQKQFLEDLERTEAKKVISEMDKALLIMHSPQDTIVGIENASDIYLAAKHPKSFISLDGADHLMSNQKDSEYVGMMAAAWAKRYIKDESQKEMAEEGEVWTRIGQTGFVTEVTAGRHQMIADEPASVGGTDLGPSPYGYLLSALGTCTAMTLRIYADFKKIDLKEVKVELAHDKIHLHDGEKSEDSKGKIDQIKRKIKLTGDLTPDQRKRLIEIADRCPVHKTLESKPIILTEEIS